MISERKNTAYYLSLLRNFPPHKKTKGRRNPYLKVRFLENKKVFFSIFIQKILQEKYDTNDKLRRLECIPELPQIFSEIKPYLNAGNYVFENKKCIVIVKKANNDSLQLLTIFPK